MDKLKTLKDLEAPVQIEKLEYAVIRSNKLREEAIKWIKAMKKVEDNDWDEEEKEWKEDPKNYFELDGLKHQAINIHPAINIMTEFFNITEEDLKND